MHIGNLNIDIGKLFLRLFAAIGVIVTLFILVGGYATWRWINKPVVVPKAPENMILALDFTNPIVEQPRSLPVTISTLLQEGEETPIIDIVRALDRAKNDPRVKGVVARLGLDQPKIVHIQEIRAALERFRKSGKFSYIYANSYGSFGHGNKAYYLASAFENIWLQPVGTVGLTGLGVDAPFGKTALEKIGISADFMRRDEYKSVMESFTRDSFSPAVRSNLKSILNNLADQLVVGIAESRGISVDKVRKWMTNGPYTANEALREGLVTRLGYIDEMLKVASLLATEPEMKSKPRLLPVQVSVSEYLSYTHRKIEPKATIAYINGIGMITDTRLKPSQLAGENFINTDELVQAFTQAAEDENIKAILFRVDSPGGSPDAAESIRHALIKAKEAKKPVFVSMGEAAASGGYWIAMNADYIVAAPATITGSIGVVGGKFVINNLMDKIGIKWDSMETSENAYMWSALKPFTDKARERLSAYLDTTYATFTQNAAEARKISKEKIPDVAKGRVWTGEQALKVGLVDELGGLATTVTAIKKHLKLDPNDIITLQQFPPPETPVALAIKILRNLGFGSVVINRISGLVQKAGSVLNPLWYELTDPRLTVVKIPGEFLQIVK